MYSPLGVPRCNDGVGGILYEFVELTIGIATRQDLVLSLEMFRGVTWLGSICALRCIPPTEEGYAMSRRRRFSGELKAKIALEALRGDRTLQEIASKHQVHPNQVSTWKRQAIDGLGEVFSNGGERRRRDHESEIRDLHAKIGELTVERDFLSRGSGR